MSERAPQAQSTTLETAAPNTSIAEHSADFKAAFAIHEATGLAGTAQVVDRDTLAAAEAVVYSSTPDAQDKRAQRAEAEAVSNDPYARREKPLTATELKDPANLAATKTALLASQARRAQRQAAEKEAVATAEKELALKEAADFKAATITERKNSPEINQQNEKSRRNIWGSGDRTYLGADGKELPPTLGKLHEILNDKKYGDSKAERQAVALDYQEDILSLVNDGYELCQAEMIMEMRQDDQSRMKHMVDQRMLEGRSQQSTDKLVQAALEEYVKKDAERLKLILENGVFTEAEYKSLQSGKELYPVSTANAKKTVEKPPKTIIKPEPEPEPDAPHEPVEPDSPVYPTEPETPPAPANVRRRTPEDPRIIAARNARIEARAILRGLSREATVGRISDADFDSAIARFEEFMRVGIESPDQTPVSRTVQEGKLAKDLQDFRDMLSYSRGRVEAVGEDNSQLAYELGFAVWSLEQVRKYQDKNEVAKLDAIRPAQAAYDVFSANITNGSQSLHQRWFRDNAQITQAELEQVSIPVVVPPVAASETVNSNVQSVADELSQAVDALVNARKGGDGDAIEAAVISAITLRQQFEGLGLPSDEVAQKNDWFYNTTGIQRPVEIGEPAPAAVLEAVRNASTTLETAIDALLALRATAGHPDDISAAESKALARLQMLNDLPGLNDGQRAAHDKWFDGLTGIDRAVTTATPAESITDSAADKYIIDNAINKTAGELDLLVKALLELRAKGGDPAAIKAAEAISVATLEKLKSLPRMGDADRAKYDAWYKENTNTTPATKEAAATQTVTKVVPAANTDAKRTAASVLEARVNSLANSLDILAQQDEATAADFMERLLEYEGIRRAALPRNLTRAEIELAEREIAFASGIMMQQFDANHPEVDEVDATSQAATTSEKPLAGDDGTAIPEAIVGAKEDEAERLALNRVWTAEAVFKSAGDNEKARAEAIEDARESVLALSRVQEWSVEDVASNARDFLTVFGEPLIVETPAAEAGGDGTDADVVVAAETQPVEVERVVSEKEQYENKLRSIRAEVRVAAKTKDYAANEELLKKRLDVVLAWASDHGKRDSWVNSEMRRLAKVAESENRMLAKADAARTAAEAKPNSARRKRAAERAQRLGSRVLGSIVTGNESEAEPTPEHVEAVLVS